MIKSEFRASVNRLQQRGECVSFLDNKIKLLVELP